MRVRALAFLALILGAVTQVAGVAPASEPNFTVVDSVGSPAVYVYDSLPGPTIPTANSRNANPIARPAAAGVRWSSASSVSLSRATKVGPGVVRGGETAATRYGREIHKRFDYGPGFEREVRLASGRRADAVNFETREIVELKPNNPRAIALGRRQLGRYADELNREFPGRPFTTRVQTYERP